MSILKRIEELNAQLASIPPPAITRLELGPIAWESLLAAAPPPRADYLPYTGPSAAMLAGIPVVVKDDMDPYGWRTIGRDGEISDTGTMLRPAPPL